MKKYIVFIALIVVAGCSYVSNNILYATGKNLKFNPITRTISGDNLRIKVERQTDMQFLWLKSKSNPDFIISEPANEFWVIVDEDSDPINIEIDGD